MAVAEMERLGLFPLEPEERPSLADLALACLADPGATSCLVCGGDLVRERSAVVCRACGSDLTREAEGRGAWVG